MASMGPGSVSRTTAPESSHDRAASMLHFVEAISASDLDLLRAHLADNDDSHTADEDEGRSRT